MRSNLQFSLDRRGAAVLLRLCWLLCGGVVVFHAAAQEGSPAALHRRTDDAEQKSTVTVTERKAPSTLPQDASGEYLLGNDPGEVIQISLQGEDLGGYISRRGDAESDQGTPLTFFFAHATLDGARLGFATHRIHGVWYSFEGTIARGSVKSRAEDGYYLLEGTLMRYDVTAGRSERRTVSLKLSRQG